MSSVLWLKIAENGSEVVVAATGAPTRLGFRAVVSPGGLIQAVSYDLHGDAEWRHNSPDLADAVATFCERARIEPPSEDMLKWGLLPNEARLNMPGASASILQLNGGTVIRLEREMDAAVIAWEGARSPTDRRDAMLGLLPRLLEMLDAGIVIDPKIRSSASVRNVVVSGVEITADQAMENLDSRVVGLTSEGWLAYYDSEHGRIMTDYRTPEQWGLHRIYPAQAFERIGLTAQHHEAAREVYERTLIAPSLAEVEEEMDRNADLNNGRSHS